LHADVRVLLVGNYLPDRQQSMQRYAALLAQHLHREAAQVDLVVPGQILSRIARRPGEVAKWLGHADKFLLFPLYLLFRSRRYDVVHVCDHGNAPYLYVLGRKPTVVTCHDCLAIRAGRGEFAALRTRWTGRMAQRVILAGLRRAHQVVCVSEATRRDLARLSGRGNATVVPNVLHHPFRRMADEEAGSHLRRLGIERRPFFVHVGSNKSYKNRPGVLKIFRELVRFEQFRDHRLVLIGPPLPRDVSGCDLGDRVLIRHDIGDEELCAIYTLADALLFPSLEEGFGWPIIEAQACGCLVVTSRREPMMSVAGEGAILIDPDDARQAGQEISSRWQDRAHLIARGFDNVQRFDRKAFVQAYAQIYTRLAAGGGR
jgi:glycosyltransferase involved in cell wall biosynthesis